MTPPIVAAVLVCAGLDWLAVATGRRRLEYVCKPLVMVLLVYGVIADPRVSALAGPVLWLCAALVFSLAGDVFLMLPRDLFLPGVGAFFLAHIAYIGSFLRYASFSTRWIVPAIVVIAIALRYGTQIVRAMRGPTEAALRLPVIAYMAVISAMVLVALATASTWVYLGAVLFLASDTMIGLSRFVTSFRWDRLAIMVTYHLGQLLLVAGALEMYAS